jgi:hypothetical protein
MNAKDNYESAHRMMLERLRRNKDNAPSATEAPSLKRASFGVWSLGILWVLDIGVWGFLPRRLLQQFLTVSGHFAQSL